MNSSQFKKQYHKYAKAKNSGPKVPPMEKHKDHEVEIQPGVGRHAAQYWCVKCNKWIAWVSKIESQKAKELGLL
jgi:hypothetical protein